MALQYGDGMKVSELTGAELDYWVARADGEKARIVEGVCSRLEVDAEHGDGAGWFRFEPSNDWAQGGPLLDKFSVDVVHELDGTFWASIDGPASVPESDVGHGGPTRLIAAMRCIVRSVYGDNVPNESA